MPTNGASIKNWFIVNKLRECTEKMLPIDTEHWKKKPSILIQIVLAIILNPKAKFILSLNNLSAYRLISFFSILPRKRDICYWVIGGSIADWIRESKVSRKAYQVVRQFLVEGNSMVETLNDCGFYNAVFVPNFKKINYLPPKKINSSKIRFLFLSRINSHKGCDLILSAAEKLNEKYSEKYEIDFYGEVAEEYADFHKKVGILPNIHYKGFVDLRESKNYDILARYDVMLFPTFWHGEGFPGIIIDAFVAGLPVIASDWHLNKDIISEGNTGYLIKASDIDALSRAMEKCITDPSTIRTMAPACQQEALKYDVDSVVTPELFKTIGLI